MSLQPRSGLPTRSKSRFLAPRRKEASIPDSKVPGNPSSSIPVSPSVPGKARQNLVQDSTSSGQRRIDPFQAPVSRTQTPLSETRDRVKTSARETSTTRNDSKQGFARTAAPTLPYQTGNVTSSKAAASQSSLESEKPRRNVLRRKNPAINRQKSTTGSSSRDEPPPQSSDPRYRGGAVSMPERQPEPSSESVFGIAPPPVPRPAQSNSINRYGTPVENSRPPVEDVYVPSSENTQYRRSSRDYQGSIPFLRPHTASPSTRFSESPGPWSRTSTPTTMSSYSPSIPMPPMMATRTRRSSTLEDRPPGPSPRPGVQAKTKETLPGPRTSPSTTNYKPSAEDSTSRPPIPTDTSNEGAKKKEKRKKKPLTPPPNPPPRKSSMKFKAPSTEAQEEMPKTMLPQRTNIPQSSKIPRTEPSLQHTRRNPTPDPSPSEPPRRPSRDGAPDLHTGLVSTPPIIQSNLRDPPGYSHNRRNSSDLKTSPKKVTQRTFNGSADSSPRPDQPRQRRTSTVSSRGASPVIPQQGQRPAIPSLNGSGSSATDLSSLHSAGPPSRGNSPMRGVSSRSTSRIGLFSRRKTPEQEDKVPKKPAKLVRKGPAAGTGHEGYGRYAVRGRSGSTTSTAGSRNRSTSNSSGTRSENSRRDSFTSKGTHDLDDFFLDRLDPVVIKGGARPGESVAAANDLLRVESNQSSVLTRPSTDSADSGSTQFSLSSRDYLDSGYPHSPIARHFTIPSDFDSNDEEASQPASIAQSTRPLHRLRRLARKTTLRIPANNAATVQPSPSPPPAMPVPTPRPSTSDSSSSRFHDLSEGKEGNWLKPKTAEKISKPSKGWNFFQRAHASSAKPTKSAQKNAQVMPDELTHPQAHYTLLENEDRISSQDLEDLVLDFENQPDTDDLSEIHSSPRRKQNGNSMLLPDKPNIPVDPSNKRSPSPRVVLGSTESLASQPVSMKQEPAPRPTRLAPVGRIPRVISTRELRASPQSFSRPFAAGKSSNTSSISNVTPDDISVSPHHQSKPFDNSARSSPEKDIGDRALQNADGRPALSNHRSKFSFTGEEFLRFSPRKGSEVSVSTSSGNASMHPPNEVSTARDSLHKEDEIWKEYDDFIDDVLSPDSGVSALDWSPAQHQATNLTPRPAGTTDSSPSNDTSTSSRRRKPTLPDIQAPKLPLIYDPGFTTEEQPSPAFISGISLNPSMSFSELLAGYNTDRSTIGDSGEHIFYPPQALDDASALRTPPPRSTTDVQSSQQEDSPKSSDSDNFTVGLDAGMNVRFAALMTSRWLSFGQVLFSPAHLEMKSANRASGQNRLLVLDGLGNDDWSFYCALTYPNAIIYNLSSTRSSSRASSRKDDNNAWQSPTNHRQIYHPNTGNPFPFPRGFFCAVVYRFPIVSSEEDSRTVISESKRVLRPGGFLELSVMDLDMMNMGNRARRALRMLKVRMHVADDTVSLKSASDNVQRLLGRRGFENLNRCTLGVPAAGTIADSRASSIDENGLSLTELLRDHTQEGDVGITKMVAKVGRWWYSRCYENMVLPDGDTTESIWNDKALLRECEKWKTSFKLLICYAQKPLSPKRRTVSV
ncbi:MAG: hypothetical protein M4579_003676 [Chaenotheca gracillima]|nr:MAG: hypothetical protein M4579_003676 [Chaenotheca gracillima]